MHLEQYTPDSRRPAILRARKLSGVSDQPFRVFQPMAGIATLFA
jgi:hypothetical protein